MNGRSPGRLIFLTRGRSTAISGSAPGTHPFFWGRRRHFSSWVKMPWPLEGQLTRIYSEGTVTYTLSPGSLAALSSTQINQGGRGAGVNGIWGRQEPPPQQGVVRSLPIIPDILPSLVVWNKTQSHRLRNSS